MNKIIACPLCNESKTGKLFSVTDYLLSKESFDLLKCEACGFIFTSDPPSPDAIGSYYKSEDYISHSDTTEGFFNRVYHLVRKIMLSKKYNLIKHYSGTNKGSILDIGCGTGYFPGYMKNKGWSALGIESDKRASAYASSKFGLDILEMDDIMSMPAEKFDAVTLWHVLEHLYEPSVTLSMADRILKEDGALIIALPNNASFDARNYGAKWAAWDVPRHLWHFNQESFSRLVSGTGFEITTVRRMPFDVFYVSVLSEQNQGKRLAFIRGIISGSIGWILSLFNKSESSSLIYVLKKKP
ncbi:MAG: class I SAM-dependent methyltransferase [Marinilabiliaceae bacterium]|jgi:2-polyprenyl-3-methyl-5-hydroxy-6-metoxy-1,4-benzoquinol methylase|nr:class I SAM-dependent methyltransferase [Marinilabiliaceae bacterium]